MLLKAQFGEFDIITKSDGELVVGGYASWELRDPQNDVITTQAQVKFLQKLFAEPEPYRNTMVKHSNLQGGLAVLKYIKPDGTTVYSHVNEVGMYLISKIRNNNWRSVQNIRKQVLEGKLGMYSISGDPVDFEVKKEHGELVRYIYDIDPWEVTLCERGVNPKAHVTVLSKAEKLCKPCVDKWTNYYLKKGKPAELAKSMAEKVVLRTLDKPSSGDCDTTVCKAVCCTFVTEWSKRSDADLKKYLHLHGVETKDAPGGMWLKYPVMCKNFDPDTKLCLDWDNRPDICKGYPRRESPFISKSVCSLLQKREGLFKMQRTPEKVKGDSKFEEIFERNWRKYVK
jgi:hypothetical protein